MNETLNKASKQSYQVLHPGNNKQNVSLALSIFDEKITASSCYVPDCSWYEWIFRHFSQMVKNCKLQTVVPRYAMLLLKDTKQIELYWSCSLVFTFSAQTSSVFVFTLQSQAMLMNELFKNNPEFILASKFQSDLVERRFS